MLITDCGLDMRHTELQASLVEEGVWREKGRDEAGGRMKGLCEANVAFSDRGWWKKLIQNRTNVY